MSIRQNKLYIWLCGLALTTSAFLIKEAVAKPYGITSIYAFGLGKITTNGDFTGSILATTVAVGHTVYLVTASSGVFYVLRTGTRLTSSRWYKKY